MRKTQDQVVQDQDELVVIDYISQIQREFFFQRKSTTLKFLLKEEIESDSSDSEDNTTDTDESEDKYYTPVESPYPPPLNTDSECLDSESGSSDNDSDNDDTDD